MMSVVSRGGNHKLVFVFLAVLLLEPLVMVHAENNSMGIRQAVLVISHSSLTAASYNYIQSFVRITGLPCKTIYADLENLSSSTFYDDNGNAKWALIVIWGNAWSYLDDTERQLIDNYEKTWNVTEAGMNVVVTPSEVLSRYGIQSFGNYIKVFNWSFAQNGLRLEFWWNASGTIQNYTTIREVTLFDNATVVIWGGNSTIDKPVLWFYKDADGVVRVASSHKDSAPIYDKSWAWMPWVLALRLSSVNILLHYWLSYDIHDMNMEGYGRNLNESEALAMKSFHDKYGVVFNLVTWVWKNVEGNLVWNSQYNDFWTVVKNNPDAFILTCHQAKSDYDNIGNVWKFLVSITDDKPFSLLNVLYYPYHTVGAWNLNSTIAQVHYEQFGVRFQTQDQSLYAPSQYYPYYQNVWIVSCCGFGWNDDWETVLANYPYVTNKEQFFRAKIKSLRQAGDVTGGFVVFHSHYPSFRNEQPTLEIMEKLFFTSGIYPVIGVSSFENAFASRTFGQNGSYTIVDPYYYPSKGTFTFKLVQNKTTPPDDLCGILVPYPTAYMPDAIMTKHEKQATFFLFKFQPGKTYTIYLNQEPESPFVSFANVWLVNARFTDRQLSITLDAPSGATSTTKVYCGSLGKPSRVDGADSWSYDESTKILTLTVTHHSPATVTVSWGVKVWFDEASILLGQFFILFTLIASIRIVKGVSDWIGGRKKPKDVFGESFTKTIMWKVVETALATAVVVLLLNVVAGMF